MNPEIRQSIDDAPPEYRQQMEAIVTSAARLKEQWPLFSGLLGGIAFEEDDTQNRQIIVAVIGMLAAEVLELQDDVRKLTALL